MNLRELWSTGPAEKIRSGGRRRAWTLFVIAAMVLAALPTGITARAADTGTSFTLTGDQLAAYDITVTDPGQQLIYDAVNTFADKYGVSQSADEMRVYAYGTTSLVVPVSMEIYELSVQEAADGQMTVSALAGLNDAVLDPSTDTGSTTTDTSTVSSTAYWSHVDHACLLVKDLSGWIDGCYEREKLVGGDGSTTRDFWALKAFATGKSANLHTLHAAQVSSTPSGKVPQQWVDWNLRSDSARSSDCVDRTLSISAQGVPLNSLHTVCPYWDITKYADAGHFDNTWRGSAWQSERETGFMIAVYVPQNQRPGFTVKMAFSASLL